MARLPSGALLACVALGCNGSLVPGHAEKSTLDTPSLTICVVSWNIQYGRRTGPDTNRWPQRWPVLRRVLLRTAPDVLCVQEALSGQLAELGTSLPNHDVVGHGRDDGVSEGEHCAILFDRRRFECLASSTFWLSETPDRPSRGWGSTYRRICTWATLRGRATGVTFRVWNTHFPLASHQRAMAVDLVLERIRAASAMPTVLVGDFNEPLGPGHWPALAGTGLTDTFHRAITREGRATYRLGGLGIARIDWILATPEWRVREHRTLDAAEDGVHASDHNGVLAVLEIPVAGHPRSR